MRLDAPIFPDTPTANPLVEQLYGRGTDVVPGTRNWSPRIGFNYDLSPEWGGAAAGAGRPRAVPRGARPTSGCRTSTRTPATSSSASGCSSIRTTGFRSRPIRTTSRPTSARPRRTRSTSSTPTTAIPQLLRGNLAYDRDLGFFNLIGSVELLFSKTLQDIDYRNLNLVESGAAPDGRPTFTRLHRDFSNVVLLTNTGEGRSWTIATKLDKRFSDNWFLSGSYLYGASRSVNDGGSSQATSNWRYNYNAGNPNAVPLAVSNFSPGHRFNLSGSYRIPAGPAGITLAAYYNAQQGRPYSYLDGSDSERRRDARQRPALRAAGRRRSRSSPTAPSTT